MQTIYFILKWIGLLLLLFVGMALIGIFIGYTSYKLEQIKPIAYFLQWCKKVFGKLAVMGMVIFGCLTFIAMILKLTKWGIIIVVVVGSFFSYLYHLIFK